MYTGHQCKRMFCKRSKGQTINHLRGLWKKFTALPAGEKNSAGCRRKKIISQLARKKKLNTNSVPEPPIINGPSLKITTCSENKRVNIILSTGNQPTSFWVAGSHSLDAITLSYGHSWWNTSFAIFIRLRTLPWNLNEKEMIPVTRIRTCAV